MTWNINIAQRLVFLAAATATLTLSIRQAHAEFVVGSWDLSRGGFDSLADAPEQAVQRALIQSYRSDAVFTSTDILTASYLSTVDSFDLGGQTDVNGVITPLTSAEQTALFDFVSNGGTLLVATDNGDLQGAVGDASRASILAPFGVATDGYANGSGVAVNQTHPIVLGPFAPLPSFPLSNSGWYTDLGPYAEAVFNESQFGNPMLATIEAGVISPTSGRVVLVADADAFSSPVLSGNILAYLMPVPEPASAVYAGTALVMALCAVGRRRRQSRVGSKCRDRAETQRQHG